MGCYLGRRKKNTPKKVRKASPQEAPAPEVRQSVPKSSMHADQWKAFGDELKNLAVSHCDIFARGDANDGQAELFSRVAGALTRVKKSDRESARRALPVRGVRKKWTKMRKRFIRKELATAEQLPKKYPGTKWGRYEVSSASPASWKWGLSNGDGRELAADWVTRIGVALRPPSGVDPFGHGHHLLFLDLRKEKSPNLFGESNTGVNILNIFESLSDFCYRKARLTRVRPPKKQAAPRPPRQKVVPIGDLNELKRKKSLRQTQAAAELDYSDRQVRNFLHDGKLTKTAKGRVAVDNKFEEQFHLRHSAQPK